MTAPFFVAFPFWGCHAERSEASPSKRFCMRSLTCVRDDTIVILRGESPEESLEIIAGDSSHTFGMTFACHSEV